MQKNRLIEMVLLSTHYIYCGWEVRKILLQYMLIWRHASMVKLLNRVRAYSFDGVWKNIS